MLGILVGTSLVWADQLRVDGRSDSKELGVFGRCVRSRFGVTMCPVKRVCEKGFVYAVIAVRRDPATSTLGQEAR